MIGDQFKIIHLLIHMIHSFMTRYREGLLKVLLVIKGKTQKIDMEKYNLYGKVVEN